MKNKNDCDHTSQLPKMKLFLVENDDLIENIKDGVLMDLPKSAIYIGDFEAVNNKKISKKGKFINSLDFKISSK